MELTEQDKTMLNNVHTVFYKARLIDSPDLAALGLQFTQFMQRAAAPQKPHAEAKAEEKLKKVQ